MLINPWTDLATGASFGEAVWIPQPVTLGQNRTAVARYSIYASRDAYQSGRSPVGEHISVVQGDDFDALGVDAAKLCRAVADCQMVEVTPAILDRKGNLVQDAVLAAILADAKVE